MLGFFSIRYFRSSDRDGDEQLTEDEFSDLPSEGVGLDLKEDRREAVGGSDDRRKEFRHLIDKNKDGKADRTELLVTSFSSNVFNLKYIYIYIIYYILI